MSDDRVSKGSNAINRLVLAAHRPSLTEEALVGDKRGLIKFPDNKRLTKDHLQEVLPLKVPYNRLCTSINKTSNKLQLKSRQKAILPQLITAD
jgi:hypothetical protein